jgi:predicted negative regulator of RcsB-dependent stress response
MFDQEEQERIDDLKVWWKQYGNMVLLGVTAFLMAIAGMQGWRYYQHSQRTQAAALYDALENAAQGNDVKKIRDAATAIIDQYPATGYAVSAALLSARVNFETGDVKSAKAQLQWVIEHASEGPSKQIARLRLAGLWLDEKNYAEALKLLESAHDAAFDGMYADLKGDVLAAEGKLPEARAAYNEAIAKTDPKNLAYRNYVQVKLDALGDAK